MTTPIPTPKRRRILSGVQPSGKLHLGNYFGAIQQHIELQDQGECFYFIADYHALTTVQEPVKLREYVRDVALTYLAFGVDPEKSTLFRQSDVPEVTELTWLLSTVTGMGLLERGVSYKDKIARGIKPSVGLFTYPVLMASDILIFDSDVVPVGRDQVQHIEFAQDMATHFNETFGDGEALLRRPEPRIQAETAYIPGIDGQKMSKSYGNTIPLFLAGKPLKKVLGGIVTDSTPLGSPLPWETCNVYALLKLFASPDELADIRGWYESGARAGQPFGYGHAKLVLAELLEQRFAPARARRAELEADPAAVDHILADAAQRARGIASVTLDRCKRACGLR
jgi:tryptophanyl-tRNA synthetase